MHAALDQARGASPAAGMSHAGLNGLSALHNYGQDGEEALSSCHQPLTGIQSPTIHLLRAQQLPRDLSWCPRTTLALLLKQDAQQTVQILP